MGTSPDSLPSWLLPEPPAPPAAAGGGASLTGRFVAGLGGFVQRTMAGDALAARRGLLQGLDARAKLLGLAALIVTAALTTSITGLLLLLAVGVALVLLSRLDVPGFAARAWLVVPLFTLAVAAPAATSWVTPGPVAVPLWGSASLTTTGLQVAARLCCV